MSHSYKVERRGMKRGTFHINYHQYKLYRQDFEFIELCTFRQT